MLLDYSVKNFNCFLDEAELSMEAPAGKVKKRFPDNFRKTKSGYDICKTAVIVGENAGGKTSFVNSFNYLKYMFNGTDEVRARAQTVHFSQENCCAKERVPQRFEIVVTGADDKIYDYELIIDFFSIVEERLAVQDTKRNKGNLVFECVRIDFDAECQKDNCDYQECRTKVHCGMKLKVGKSFAPPEIYEYLERSMKNVRFKGLVVSKLALIGIREAMDFQDIIQNQIIAPANNVGLDLYMAVKKDEEDFAVMKDPRFFDIFRMVDHSICAMELDEKMPLQDTLIVRKDKNGNEYKRKIRYDSSGVREFFAWAVQIFKVVYEDRIVIADEMDRVLNPVLSDRIISYVNGMEHRGQFIFTTHNVLHLNLNTYMKEQINFVTKDSAALTSEMYSLADFPDIRYETAKVYEFYMKGILGGTADE